MPAGAVGLCNLQQWKKKRSLAQHAHGHACFFNRTSKVWLSHSEVSVHSLFIVLFPRYCFHTIGLPICVDKYSSSNPPPPGAQLPYDVLFTEPRWHILCECLLPSIQKSFMRVSHVHITNKPRVGKCRGDVRARVKAHTLELCAACSSHPRPNVWKANELRCRAGALWSQ